MRKRAGRGRTLADDWGPAETVTMMEMKAAGWPDYKTSHELRKMGYNRTEAAVFAKRMRLKSARPPLPPMPKRRHSRDHPLHRCDIPTVGDRICLKCRLPFRSPHRVNIRLCYLCTQHEDMGADVEYGVSIYD